MDAAISWSYDLLSDREKFFFQRLSIFVDGWTLEAVGAICSGDGVDEGGVLDLLTALVDKSLVVAGGESGEMRFNMLESIRQFAQAKHLNDDDNDLRLRHARFFASWSRDYNNPNVNYKSVSADIRNLKAAFDYVTSPQCKASDAPQLAYLIFLGARLVTKDQSDVMNWFHRLAPASDPGSCSH